MLVIYRGYGQSYKFSFKYPPDWGLSENDHETDISLTLRSPDYQTSKSYVGEEVITGARITIDVVSNSIFTLDKLIEDYSKLGTATKVSFTVGGLGIVQGVEYLLQKVAV